MNAKPIGLFEKFANFIHIPYYSFHYDKKYESDHQMIIRVSRKFVISLFIVFMFDTLLDWLLSLIDSVIELIHLMIEFFEYSFESILQQTLETNHHQSEIIMVNATIIIALYGLYRFKLVVPKLYVYGKNKLSAAWLGTIERESSCWKALTLMRKIKLISVYCIWSAFFLSLLSI